MELLGLPPEILVSIFRFLEAPDVMVLRLTSRLLHVLSLGDAILWRPLYNRAFGTSRPRRAKDGSSEEDNNRLHVPPEKVVELIITQSLLTWEWAYKSKALSLVELMQRGATCYAMPKVRFPPARWVAYRDEPNQGMWRYEGEWMDTERDGYGACRFLNGNLYCGQWAHDMMHGRGVMLYGDGSVYDGAWCHNARHGKGSFKWLGRWTYTGDWKDGKRSGWGTLVFAWPSGGEQAEGEQLAELPKLRQLDSVWGVGLVSWHGRWRRNRPEGEGTATFADGGVYHGICKNKWRLKAANRGWDHDEWAFVGLLKKRVTVAGWAPGEETS